MKKKLQKYSILYKITLLFYAITVLITLVYWIYYKFVVGQVISSSHFKFRQFIFWNNIREIVVLFIILGVIYSTFIAFKYKKYTLLFISIGTLIIQIILLNQLQIYKGP
jgi:hypothetical protein